MTRHTRGKVTWIDLESPTHQELNAVMEEFNINARIEDEIISPTPYPISITFPDYEYMVLHFPTAGGTEGTRTQEVDFIVGKHFLITARYEVVESLHSLHRVFEAEELLGVPDKELSTQVLVEQTLRRLYAAISGEAEQLLRSLERIEDDIFSGKERATVRSISEVSRVLLKFDTVLTRHKEPLTEFLLELQSSNFFGKQFAEHASRIEAEREHAASIVASYRAVASELRITNDSLLSAAQNEIMKQLTIMSFIILPLSLITGIFGMNIETMPIVSKAEAFWIIILLMATLVVLFFGFFKWKRWF
jgi:magnesium transporter